MAIDLQLEVDDFVLENPGNEVTRVVRVFNNGDETATDALVQSALTSQMENAIWTRNGGFAKFVHRDVRAVQESDFVIRSFDQSFSRPIGDVNGDGFLDVAVWKTRRGAAFARIAFGGHGQETAGFNIMGQGESPEFKPLGDVNGDGIDDFGFSNYAVFGAGNLGSLGTLNVSDLDGSNGFALDDHSSVHGIGDFNSDGFDDIAFTSRGRLTTIVWGNENVGAGGVVTRSDLRDGNGAIAGRRTSFLAHEVGSVGDINGDGHQDVGFSTIVDGGLAEDELTVDVVLGGPSVNLHLRNDRFQFTVTDFFAPDNEVSQAGLRNLNTDGDMHPRSAGDVTGDGIDDLLIAHDGGNCFSNCPISSQSYLSTVGGALIVPGRADIGEESIVDAQIEGAYLFRIESPTLESTDAYTVDRNSDGIMDIIVSADDREMTIFGGSQLRSYDFGVDGTAQFNGENGFAAAGVAHSSVQYDSSPEILDANGDGVLDRFVEFDGDLFDDTLILYGAGELPKQTVLLAGAGDVHEVVNIPAGASLIYRVTGTLRPDASTALTSAVAGTPEQAEFDLTDNVFPRQQDAVYLDVTATGQFDANTLSVTIELTVTNHGPDVAEFVTMEETFLTGLKDITWSFGTQPFPEQSSWNPAIGPRLVGELRFDSELLGVGTGRLGDVNGDGFEDFYVANLANGDPGIRIFWGGTDFGDNGSLIGPLGSTTLRDAGGAIPLGDIDSDGFDDFLVHKAPHPHVSPFLIVYGQAKFPSSENGFIGSLVQRRRGYTRLLTPLGDVNGDGLEDMGAGRHIVFARRNTSVDESLVPILNDTNSVVVLPEESGHNNVWLTPLGDVNADGFDDVAVVTWQDRSWDSSAYVLFGESNMSTGIVSMTTASRIGASAEQLYWPFLTFAPDGHHDLNGDGVHDIVVRSGHSAITSVILGRRELEAQDIDLQNFALGEGFSIHGEPSLNTFIGSDSDQRSLAVADIDGDGFDDVVFVNGNREILIYRGGADAAAHELLNAADSSGPSNFIRIVDTTGHFSLAVATGLDVNGDGVEDVIVGDHSEPPWAEHGPAGESYVVFGRQSVSGVGAGPIPGPVNIPGGATVTYQITATSATTDGGSLGTVTVSTSPQQTELYPATNSTTVELEVVPRRVPLSFVKSTQRIDSGNHDNSGDGDLGDLDGDGDVDLFVTVDGGPNQVWFNDGIGNFEDSGQRFGDGRQIYSALGDIDQDGDLDVVVAASAGYGNRLWLNDGSGQFTDSGQVFGDPAVASVDVALADVSGDGALDVLIANDNNTMNWVFLNQGDGSFRELRTELPKDSSKSIEAADLDRDGIPDLIIGNSTGLSSVSYPRSVSSNFFLSAAYRALSVRAEHITAGDLDGDGDADLVSGEAGDNRIWLNNGQGRFSQSPEALVDGFTSHVALGDLDNDGDLDVVAANWSGDASRIWINQSGEFRDSGLELDAELRSEHAALGDIDGDGDLDMHFAIRGEGSVIYFNNTRLLRADLDVDGEVGFSDFQILANHFGQAPASRAEGDIDDDRDVDFDDFVALVQDYGKQVSKN